MNHRFSALALAGVLSLSLLAGCSASAQPPVSPSQTPAAPSESLSPLPSESVQPSESLSPLPESSETPDSQPSETPSQTPETSAKPTEKPAQTPAASAKPSAKPSQTPSATPTPSEKPQASVVQSVWKDISALDLPASMIDLDADTLKAIYGIDSADLVEYVCKMPMMNTQATEFFIAQVKDGKMDAVKAAVEDRQADMDAQWSTYLPEQYGLVQNYKLVTSGNYILFAVSEYADDAVSIFDSYAK